MKITDLQTFLKKAAAAGYANEKAEIVDESDGSHTITFIDGDFSYHDNFFGGEPYGGWEVAFYQTKPVWMCAYYGYLADKNESSTDIYKFLRTSLKAARDEGVARGPNKYEEGALIYANNCTGSIQQFNGKEKISRDNLEIYRAHYVGGLVSRS